MGDYGDNISRISDLIKQSQDAPLESIDEQESTLFQQATLNANKKATEYTDKWDTIKEKGDEELAGVLGIEVPLKGYKKAKSLYKKYKEAKSKIESSKKSKEDVQDPDFEKPETPSADVDSGEGGGASADVNNEVSAEQNNWIGDMKERLNNLDELPSSSSAQMTNPITNEPLLAEKSGTEGLENGIGDFADRVKQVGSDALDTLKSGLGKVGDFVKGAKNKLFSSTTKDAGKIATKVGEDEGVGIFDSVAGSIPLIGEGALAITGLISIGRAFAHLFKHKKHFTPKTPQLVGMAIPSANPQLTQKYSMGLPSIDSASEVSASFSAF